MARVHARDIVVEFPVYGGKSRSLKNTVIRAATGGVLAKDAADHVVVRAIDHVSFDWKEGDRIGLYGHNGSGKTTLLRTIAGIYEPVQGDLLVQGRIVSMLSMTLGMDMEATGYENISLRGMLMGLTRKQISALTEDVCEFSDLGEYIDLPMRTYSSGMAMRLAFAVSTSVKADIIIMDEWLSVGDADFAEKARKRLRTVVDEAKILVIASHSLDVLRENCTKTLTLNRGQIVSEG